MSEYFAPQSNATFNAENILSNDNENVSMDRLEEEFAKKFNSKMFNDCQIDGGLEITENLSLNNIQSLTSENINFNNSIDMKNNNIYFGNDTYASKITKKNYQMNGSLLQIPISAKNDQNVYLINVSRSDGIFDFANNCPLFVSYFLISKVSFVKPVPIIQNLVQSFEYNLQDNILSIIFAKDFSNLDMKISISQLQ